LDTPATEQTLLNCILVMNEIAQQTEFLSWKIAPARLNATQTAWFLGFDPSRNSTKYFATEILEQLRRDEKWLARASDAICNYWRDRNARKRTCGTLRKGEHAHA
jgi:hypothetical protein